MSAAPCFSARRFYTATRNLFSYLTHKKTKKKTSPASTTGITRSSGTALSSMAPRVRARTSRKVFSSFRSSVFLKLLTLRRSGTSDVKKGVDSSIPAKISHHILEPKSTVRFDEMTPPELPQVSLLGFVAKSKKK